jgi:hypothetical protein
VTTSGGGHERDDDGGKNRRRDGRRDHDSRHRRGRVVLPHREARGASPRRRCISPSRPSSSTATACSSSAAPTRSTIAAGSGPTRSAPIRIGARTRRPAPSAGSRGTRRRRASASSPTGVSEYRAAVTNGLIEHERVHMFRAEADSPPSRHRTRTPTRWPRRAGPPPIALRAEIAAHPERFTPWFRIYVGSLARFPLRPRRLNAGACAVCTPCGKLCAARHSRTPADGHSPSFCDFWRDLLHICARAPGLTRSSDDATCVLTDRSKTYGLL